MLQKDYFCVDWLDEDFEDIDGESRAGILGRPERIDLIAQI